MGEQVTFDSNLTRTVQARSCDQCFGHKSKCSRHTPCHTCVTYHRTCTYERRSRYRRRSHSTASQSLVSIEVPSNSTTNDNPICDNVISEEGSLEASSSPETIDVLNTVAMEAAARNFSDALGLLSECPNSVGFDWVNPSFPDNTDFLNDINRLVEVPSLLSINTLEAFRSPAWSTDDQLFEFNTENDRQLARYIMPDNIWPMINLFLDRLHPSMPFFKRSYLIDNIHAKRYLHDQPFNALIHAISALAIFQTVQGSSEQFRSSDQIDKAETFLAEAVRLHSHTNFGEEPVLENVLTSVFLFGCQFCKGNHRAARFRLREAGTLAETMGLDDPQSYGHIARDEKDRRLRTYVSLMVIHRVYAIQRDSPVNDYLLTSRALLMVRQMIEQVSINTDQAEVRAVRDLGYMIDLIDFVDPTFVKCWRNKCWTESDSNHISSEAISALLQRYTAPIFTKDSPNDAQRADFLITRHWICHILWDSGSQHGFMYEDNPVVQMRPDYARKLARDSIETCESFDMACLEYHGIGLVEKLYDIVTSAIRVVHPAKVVNVGSHSQCALVDHPHGYTGLWPIPIRLERDSLKTAEFPGSLNIVPTPNASTSTDFANRFLVLFATFRGGNHPYLKPYMRMLCDIDLR